MTRVFWDAILLISGEVSWSEVDWKRDGANYRARLVEKPLEASGKGSLFSKTRTLNIQPELKGNRLDQNIVMCSFFTFGAGPRGSSVIEANIFIDTISTAAPETSSSNSLTTSGKGTTTPNFFTVKSSFVSSGAEQTNATVTDGTDTLNASAVATSYTPTSNSPTTSNGTTSTTRRPAATTSKPVKKFVAAAVRSHFDDCPDSHRHFCFHGTCRFLILEETPACVCHPGFVGMRCEHADLLAVVATNHRKQAVATVLVLCVIGCVLIMVLCSFLHCWWREDCRRRSRAHLYVAEKHGATCYPPESVV